MLKDDTRTAFMLADLTCEVKYKTLPDGVIKKAKELIADSVACMVGGVKSIQGEKIIEVFASMKGVPEVQIYGSRERLPLLNAVYVNSYSDLKRHQADAGTHQESARHQYLANFLCCGSCGQTI